MKLGPDAAAWAVMRCDVMDVYVVAVGDLDAAAAEVIGVQEAVLHRLLLAYVSVRPDDFKAWLLGDSITG